MNMQPIDWVRLACNECDRDEYDGITEDRLEQLIQDGWEDVEAVNSWAVATAEDDDSEWWTHLGTCPECLVKNHLEAV